MSATSFKCFKVAPAVRVSSPCQATREKQIGPSFRKISEYHYHIQSNVDISLFVSRTKNNHCNNMPIDALLSKFVLFFFAPPGAMKK